MCGVSILYGHVYKYYIFNNHCRALSSYFKNFQALNDEKRAFITEAVKRIYGLLIIVCSSLEVESYPLCHSLNALGYLIKVS